MTQGHTPTKGQNWFKVSLGPSDSVASVLALYILNSSKM